MGEQNPTRFVYGVRPPLKIMLFPVHRPGELISAEWILFFFFHIFEIIFFPQHFPHHFYTEKKNILRPPDWPQS